VTRESLPASSENDSGDGNGAVHSRLTPVGSKSNDVTPRLAMIGRDCRHYKHQL